MIETKEIHERDPELAKALTSLVDAWNTYALAYHPSASNDVMDEVGQAIMVVKKRLNPHLEEVSQGV